MTNVVTYRLIEVSRDIKERSAKEPPNNAPNPRPVVKRNVGHPAGERRGGQEVGKQYTDNKVSTTAKRIYKPPEDQDYVAQMPMDLIEERLGSSSPNSDRSRCLSCKGRLRLTSHNDS